MGLPVRAIKLIVPVLPKADVLCFGNPDLLVSPEKAKKFFGVSVSGWDGGKGYGLPHQLADTREVFNALGAASTYIIDMFPNNGVDLVGCDLNEPHPEWAEKFDLVIDPGTMEHCANVGQALMTAAGSVRAGGHVLHISPVSMINHGFYNMCPTLLRDFYEQNGWTVKYLGAFIAYAPYSDIEWSIKFDYGRVPMENNLSLLALVHRGPSATKLKWPTQKRWLIPAKKVA